MLTKKKIGMRFHSVPRVDQMHNIPCIVGRASCGILGKKKKTYSKLFPQFIRQSQKKNTIIEFSFCWIAIDGESCGGEREGEGWKWILKKYTSRAGTHTHTHTHALTVKANRGKLHLTTTPLLTRNKKKKQRNEVYPVPLPDDHDSLKVIHSELDWDDFVWSSDSLRVRDTNYPMLTVQFKPKVFFFFSAAHLSAHPTHATTWIRKTKKKNF